MKREDRRAQSSAPARIGSESARKLLRRRTQMRGIGREKKASERLRQGPLNACEGLDLPRGEAIEANACANACARAASFLLACAGFRLPLRCLLDQPGSMIGADGSGGDGQKRDLTGKAIKRMNALSLVTVPKNPAIMGRAYGQAVRNMGGGSNHSHDVILPRETRATRIRLLETYVPRLGNGVRQQRMRA